MTGRTLAPHITLLVRAHYFCQSPSTATQAELVAAVEAAARADAPDEYSPLFAACLGVRAARPREWPALVAKIDAEIHALGTALRAGGWFKRKDIAA